MRTAWSAWRWGRLAVAGWLSCAGVCASAPAPAADAASTLTPVETHWLQAAWPVLLYARDAGLPLDIVVQPQAAPGLPPMGLAYIDGRCKLVFSMRGNPEVQASADRIPPELFNAALQLMAAHELGHCQRHLAGRWHQPPLGLPVALRGPAAAPVIEAERREEAYADLVGLAWASRHHAADYVQLHAWLVRERLLARSHGRSHDTLAWARLAERAERWGSRSVFAEADTLWAAGLNAED